MAPVDTRSRVRYLEREVERLTEELKKASEREQDLESTRRAMLYLLEDLNESSGAILKAKNEWESTFDSISDPIFIHDTSFNIVRCNRAYQTLSGLRYKEIMGRPYYEVFPKMDGPFESSRSRVSDGPESKEEEIEIEGLGRIFRVKFYPVASGHESQFYINVLEDITEERRAEQKIEEEAETTRQLLMIADATAETSDLDRLLERVVQCTQKIMGSDVCLSYLWDNDARLFRPREGVGLERGSIHLFRTVTIEEKLPFIGTAFYGGLAEIRKGGKGGSTQAFGLFNWIGGLGAMTVIPLSSRQGFLGLIICLYGEENPRAAGGLAERDRALVRGIARQISMALEDARLFKESVDRTMELSHKVETIQAMHEIDKNILSTLEPQEILDISASMISRLIACDRAVVLKVDRQNGGFTIAAGTGEEFTGKGMHIPLRSTMLAEVLNSKRPMYVADLLSIRKPPSLERKLARSGFRSMLRVPVMTKGEVTGIICLISRRPSAFVPEDLSTLEKLASQVGVGLENARLLTDLEDLFLGTVRSLSDAIDAKSPWTHGHSMRVTRYALEIARSMGFDEEGLKELELAGLLHDIGKLGTYESILDKPGRLTDEEMEIMRQHPVTGSEILGHINQLRHIIPAIRHHHEYYDGSGYPDGVKGEEIPLMARILSVADTVDAMSADRPYRKGRPMDAIIEELKRCSGTQFDPQVVEAALGVLPGDGAGGGPDDQSL